MISQDWKSVSRIPVVNSGVYVKPHLPKGLTKESLETLVRCFQEFLEWIHELSIGDSYWEINGQTTL